jgi:hypothetical protein
MGQDGQEFGLAMFTDWLQVCRFMHNTPVPLEFMTNQGSLKQLRAADGAESFSLSEMVAYHPEDIHYLQALGIQPAVSGLYPVVARFKVVADEPELEDPKFSLPDYTLLLQAMAELLGKRRSQQLSSVKTTLELDGHTVELRYPAKGDETPLQDSKPYRLVIEGNKQELGNRHNPLNQGEDIVVVADSTLYDVAKALRKANNDIYFMGFGFGEDTNAAETNGDDEENAFLNLLLTMNDTSGTYLWSSRDDGRYGPHLRVGDIAHLRPLWADSFLTHFKMRLEPLETDVPEGVRVLKV